MKKLILFLFLLIFSTQGILSQEKKVNAEKSPQELENYYAMKFKKKAATASSSLQVSFGTISMPKRNNLALGVSYNF